MAELTVPPTYSTAFRKGVLVSIHAAATRAREVDHPDDEESAMDDLAACQSILAQLDARKRDISAPPLVLAHILQDTVGQVLAPRLAEVGARVAESNECHCAALIAIDPLSWATKEGRKLYQQGVATEDTDESIGKAA